MVEALNAHAREMQANSEVFRETVERSFSAIADALKNQQTHIDVHVPEIKVPPAHVVVEAPQITVPTPKIDVHVPPPSRRTVTKHAVRDAQGNIEKIIEKEE
jgi:hypothetical protein